MTKVFEELTKATQEAKAKHKEFPTSREAQLSILVEECGEIAEVANDKGTDERFKREVLDAGAVIVRILEGLQGVEAWN